MRIEPTRFVNEKATNLPVRGLFFARRKIRASEGRDARASAADESENRGLPLIKGGCAVFLNADQEIYVFRYSACLISPFVLSLCQIFLNAKMATI